jgi:hypothetical protein
MILSRRYAVLLSLAVFLAASSARAQQPPPPNPAAPTLGSFTPLGAQPGTTLELTLTGTNLSDPIALWTSLPGVRAMIPSDNNNGKDVAKLRVKLEVAKDTAIGYCALRLATRRGMSNVRLFCIDDLPSAQATPASRNRATAQLVQVPCVVTGKADQEQTDYFRINVKAGQRLSFEVLGHRLGSGFDPQLSLLEARTGRELAYSNDSPGLQTDARLTHTFREAGDYLIAVRDVTYRGGPDFYYRLRIGDFPCATTPIPMAARRGGRAWLRFAGPNVDGVGPIEVAVPDDPMIHTLWVAPTGSSGLHGWPVPLAISNLDELIEQEPNNDSARANRVPVPCGITGRFEQKGDIDHYVFSARKGQRLVIEARTQELQSPTEVYMVLRDSKSAQVAASNPQVGQRIDYTPTADEDYTLAVEHLHYWGGPAETYHLTIAPYEPGFDLSIGLDRWDAAQAGAVTIPILAARHDYAGPIEVSVVGPPGISGAVTIAAGQPPQPNAPAGQLVVSVKPDVPLGPHLLRIQGKATINGKPVVAFASVAAPVKSSLANLPYPPQQLLDQVALAVTPIAPFTLKAETVPVKLLPGSKASLKVTATRQGGYTGPIAVEVRNLPANVTAAKGTIAAGQTTLDLEISAAAAAKAGDKGDVNVLGTATAAENRTAATSNFTVSIGKK